MARHTIYMTPSVEKRVREYLKAMRDDGAIGSEATISGFGGKLLELGLRLYKSQQESDNNPVDALDIERLLLRESILTRHMLEANYRTLLKLPEIRKELTLSPSDMLVAIRAKAEKEYMENYGENE